MQMLMTNMSEFRRELSLSHYRGTGGYAEPKRYRGTRSGGLVLVLDLAVVDVRVLGGGAGRCPGSTPG